MNQSMKVQTGCTGKKNTLIIEEDRNSRGGGETILISMKFPLANLSTHRDICAYIVHIISFIDFSAISFNYNKNVNFYKFSLDGGARDGTSGTR